jgi:hypothetical protein
MKAGSRSLSRSIPIWCSLVLFGTVATSLSLLDRSAPAAQDSLTVVQNIGEIQRWEERRRLDLERGRLNAARDASSGHLRVRGTWRADSSYADLVRERYGVEVVPGRRCSMGDFEQSYWEGYNEVSHAVLLRRFGTYRFEDCEAEVRRADAYRLKDCLEKQGR